MKDGIVLGKEGKETVCNITKSMEKFDVPKGTTLVTVENGVTVEELKLADSVVTLVVSGTVNNLEYTCGIRETKSSRLHLGGSGVIGSFLYKCFASYENKILVHQVNIAYVAIDGGSVELILSGGCKLVEVCMLKGRKGTVKPLTIRGNAHADSVQKGRSGFSITTVNCKELTFQDVGLGKVSDLKDIDVLNVYCSLDLTIYSLFCKKLNAVNCNGVTFIRLTAESEVVLKGSIIKVEYLNIRTGSLCLNNSQMVSAINSF